MKTKWYEAEGPMDFDPQPHVSMSGGPDRILDDPDPKWVTRPVGFVHRALSVSAESEPLVWEGDYA